MIGLRRCGARAGEPRVVRRLNDGAGGERGASAVPGAPDTGKKKANPEGLASFLFWLPDLGSNQGPAD